MEEVPGMHFATPVEIASAFHANDAVPATHSRRSLMSTVIAPPNGDHTTPLLFNAEIGGHLPAPSVTEPRALVTRFFFMATFFSINHGTVTALLSLASINLGPDLGGDSSGALYAAYTVSAATIAASVSRNLGPKRALVLSMLLYCFYVASFAMIGYLWSPPFPSLAYVAAIIGSVVGGCGAGFLWTAQGSFLTLSAHAIAKGSKEDVALVTARLASAFAAIYVGFEVSFKLMASIIQLEFGRTVVFIAYTIACVASTLFVALFIPSPPPLQNAPGHVADAARPGIFLVYDFITNRNNRSGSSGSSLIWCFLPFNILFGFASALFTFWINGSVAAAAVGAADVGYLTAVSPAAATMFSLVLLRLKSKISKPMMMSLASLLYVSLCVFIYLSTSAYLQNLGWKICILYSLGGIGRAVFESTNKAILADVFPFHKDAAFASATAASGGSAAIAFFLFPHLDKGTMVLITGISALISVVALVPVRRFK